MRNIKVTFRAVFQQPIGELNPMGCKIPGPQPVEIFQKGESWLAREITSPRRQVYEKLGRFTSIEHAKRTLVASFARQPQEWQMWGTVPGDGKTTLIEERLLLPDEVAHLGGDKWGLRCPEDYTHIIHAPTIPPAAKIPPAACGEQVDAKCFINNKANVKPTCKKCAEVWKEFYQEKRA